MKRWKKRAVQLAFFACLLLLAGRAALAQPAVYNHTITGDRLRVIIGNVQNVQSVSCQIGSKKCSEVSVTGSEDLETAILVDNSLSIDSRYRDTIYQILNAFIDTRAEKEAVTIATFDKELHYLVQKSMDPGELYNVISGITYQNLDTKVTDVLYYLCQDLKADPFDGLRRIVLISDGAEYSSVGYTRQEMLSELKALAYPVYTIGCTYLDNAKELEDMFSLSRMTGGEAVWLDEIADPQAIVQKCNSCREAVAVEMKIPDSMGDGTEKGIKIDLVTDEGSVTVSSVVAMPFLEAGEIREQNGDASAFLEDFTSQDPDTAPLILETAEEEAPSPETNENTEPEAAVRQENEGSTENEAVKAEESEEKTTAADTEMESAGEAATEKEKESKASNKKKSGSKGKEDKAPETEAADQASMDGVSAIDANPEGDSTSAIDANPEEEGGLAIDVNPEEEGSPAIDANPEEDGSSPAIDADPEANAGAEADSLTDKNTDPETGGGKEGSTEPQPEAMGLRETEEEVQAEETTDSDAGIQKHQKDDPIQKATLLVVATLLAFLLIRRSRQKKGSAKAKTARHDADGSTVSGHGDDDATVYDRSGDDTSYGADGYDGTTRFGDEEDEEVTRFGADEDMTTFSRDEEGHTEVDPFLYEDRTMVIQDEDPFSTGTVNSVSVPEARIRLTDVQNPIRVQETVFTGNVKIGRSPQYNQLVLDYDRTVSSRHCEVYFRDGDYYIRDLGSSNGTWVDDRHIEEETVISSGAVLRLGRLELIFEII